MRLVKIGLVERVLLISQIQEARLFGLSCGGIFKRIQYSESQVSFSQGTKFQRINRHGRCIWAPVGLREGVDVSCIMISHLFCANCMMKLVSACLSWCDTFFGQHRTSVLKLCEHFAPQLQGEAAGCAGGGQNMHLLCQRWATKYEDRLSTSLQTKHHDPEVDYDSILSQSIATALGPTEFAYFKVLVTACQSLSLSTWLLRLMSEQSKQGQCTVRMKI